jgi:hypothetical protein
MVDIVCVRSMHPSFPVRAEAPFTTDQPSVITQTEA